ncbi:MAG: DMT family transporter [Paracoccaceae bacterium]
MSSQARGHLAMLAFSLLVAGSFALGAMAANDISPMALNAARFWIAGVVIGGVVLARGGIPKEAIEAPWRYLVLGGLFAAYFVLMFEGLKTAEATSAAAVFTLIPLMSAFFGWLLLRQVATRRMALALLIGAFGALWVIFRADLSALLAFQVGKGEVIYFVGCIFHAIYTPMIRKLNRGESAFVFSLGTIAAGAILLTIFGWSSIRATDWTNLPAIVWITLFYVAIFASAATFILLQFASLRLPSAKVMAYTYLTPTWVIVWQVLLGRDVPEGIVLFGVTFTCVALWLLLRPEGEEPSA